MKKCFAIALTLAAAFAATEKVDAGVASAIYDPATGGITATVTDVNNWYVESTAGSVMTGDEPINLPQGGGAVSNSDVRVGETGFTTLFSYADVFVGNVAQTGLPEDGTLRIYWNTGLGTALEDVPVVFAGAAVGSITQNRANGFDYLSDTSLELTATGFGTGLTYEWDLDNDGNYDDGTGEVLLIADVLASLGPAYDPYPTIANYPVSVRASDNSTADASINYVPEPTSLALAGLGLIGLVARRRRNG